jgi:glutaredoxin 3
MSSNRMTCPSLADPQSQAGQSAELYRMVLSDHTCPFGVRAKALLEEGGFKVDDKVLKTRQEVDDFEAEQGVDTTPQIFIDGRRIGGCDDLEQYLAKR